MREGVQLVAELTPCIVMTDEEELTTVQRAQKSLVFRPVSIMPRVVRVKLLVRSQKHPGRPMYEYSELPNAPPSSSTSCMTDGGH